MPGLFEALTTTHETFRHPFFSYSPNEDRVVVLASMPPGISQEERSERCAEALRRLFSHGEFKATILGLEGINDLAEYQFWSLSDWVTGGTGEPQSALHFHLKSWEEYIEAQDEISDGTDGMLPELADVLFCSTALASNESLPIHDLQASLERAGYHADSSAKSGNITFDMIDELVKNEPDIVLKVTSSWPDPEFYQGIPEQYFVVGDGMEQQTDAKTIRLYRTILSSAKARVESANLILEDDEYDYGRLEGLDRAQELLSHSVLITLLLMSYIAQKSGSTLKSAVDAHVQKITGRVRAGMPATKLPGKYRATV